MSRCLDLERIEREALEEQRRLREKRRQRAKKVGPLGDGLMRSALEGSLLFSFATKVTQRRGRKGAEEEDGRSQQESASGEPETLQEGRLASAVAKAQRRLLERKRFEEQTLLEFAKSLIRLRVPLLVVHGERSVKTIDRTVDAFLEPFLSYRSSLFLSQQCIPLSKVSLSERDEPSRGRGEKKPLWGETQKAERGLCDAPLRFPSRNSGVACWKRGSQSFPSTTCSRPSMLTL